MTAMAKQNKQDKHVKKLKSLASTLFLNKQITRKLFRLILEADYTDTTYVFKLKALTEDLLRVKGYYSSNDRIAFCDKVIDEWLTIQSK